MDKNTVLSVSPSQEALVFRQAILQNSGMKVISVLTLAEARFEIEMGRCGNLLICYRLSVKSAEDIAQLYKRDCPEGRIVFVTDDSRKKIPTDETSDNALHFIAFKEIVSVPCQRLRF